MKNYIEIIKEEVRDMCAGYPGFKSEFLARGISNIISQFGSKTTTEGIIDFLEDLSKISLTLKKNIEKRLSK